MTSSSFRSGNASDDYQEESGILDDYSLEDRLAEAFESLAAKSAKTRLAAYEFCRKTLTQRYMMEFVFSRKVTLLDSLSRCMKRAKGQDLSLAAALVSALCSTLGPAPDTDPLFSELISQLLLLSADQTVHAEVRSSCARATGLCTFILGADGCLEPIMDRLYAILSASFAKGDNTMPNPSDQIAALHATCIQTWTLLLTALASSSTQIALDLVEECMDQITQLLDSPHLDVKIAAGETLAVMYEIVKSQSDIVEADFSELSDKIHELMKDTPKYRGKKDLREQRSNFREILATIEEGEMPNVIIKFGRERLILESWSMRRQYDAFCELFGTGLNQHLSENELIRDIFSLGPVMVHMDLPRVKRSDNSHVNMLADKNRTKNMRRLRDKRADVID